MNIEERINAFSALGQRLRNLSGEELDSICQSTAIENPWFTRQFVLYSIQAIADMLQPVSLNQWIRKYDLSFVNEKKIGVAMAGNIPLVGFHDLLCVLIGGHALVAKFSSQDSILMRFVCDLLQKINPAFERKISIKERLKDIDAVIATGSDNTSRYFEYYFRAIPSLIRKHRSSCAIISGQESLEELTLLGEDVFSYFGMGCRNVSKLFLPEGYNPIPILKAWEKFLPLVGHHKYANNYTYQRSILLMNQIHFYDNGVVILVENPLLSSPLSIVYYQFYKSISSLKESLSQQRNKIQCIVSANEWYENSVAFGKTQKPQLWDYADTIDTIHFLVNLK